MNKAIEKMQNFYNQVPGAELVQEEFGYFCLDRWKKEGHISDDTDLNELFGYDVGGRLSIWKLGWCEAAFCPPFETKVLEDLGDQELVQDFAGRTLLCFKGRRRGFMPTYVSHAVTDMDSWERVKFRLDAATAERYADLEQRMSVAKEKQAEGVHIVQHLAGGCMYLRSLMGCEEMCFKLYDEPELIHACMKTWFELADGVIAKHQQHVTINELFLAEDICYNGGPLFSPDMIREYFFPYYQQLIANIKARQNGRSFVIQVDTDGDCRPVIPLYMSIGCTYFSPFEVAAGCDVVELRKKYPNLLMRGGFDKRILAAGKDAISREVERIMPFMKAQGGYIPTCDHGVPEEVSFENYMHYRELMKQF